MPPRTIPPRAKRGRFERGQHSGANQPNPDVNPNPSFENVCFRDDIHRNRYINVYKFKDIRTERTIDLDFLMSPDYDFDLFDLFVDWGWLDFLSIAPYTYRRLVRAFYANAEFIRDPNGTNPIIGIESFLIGTEFEITPESIAALLGVPLGGNSNEYEPHLIQPFPDDRPTHLSLEERLFHLLTTWFFRSSGGKATSMRVIDYWWLRQYRDRSRPDIATIIFLNLVKVISNPTSFSLPFGCVLSHIFRKLNIDTTLDPPVKNKSKIDIKSCHKAQWYHGIHGWVHRGVEEFDDDAPEEPVDEDAPAPVVPITMESMYVTMVTRFDNMDAFIRNSHEETMGMLRSLDGRVTSLEHDMHDVRGHLFPPPSPHDAPDS